MYSKLLPQAIQLRQKGYLYSEIASQLGIAKSTAYVWTHEVILTEAATAAHTHRTKQAQLAKVAHLAGLNRLRHKNRDEALRANAHDIVQSVKFSDAHKKILCAVFFWCEGGKDVAGGLHFINSDPVMMRLFLTLLRQSFSLDESKFRAIIHLHDYHDPARQLEFWSGVTDIPKSQFYRPYIKPHTGKNNRAGYPGCLSVRYLDVALGKSLQMIYTELGKKTP